MGLCFVLNRLLPRADKFGTRHAFAHSTSRLCTGTDLEARMKVSPRWMSASAAPFELDDGRAGCAQLSHYTANFHEWGDGPPLVIIPGMAGGIDLIAPLAR